MMNSFKKFFRMDVPAGWSDVFIRTVKAGVLAFVILQLKDGFDAGRLLYDAPATAWDATLIAGGTFALNAILTRAKS